MFKKLIILLLVGCLTLFVGFKTFATDTVNLGDDHNESSYTLSATIDTYDPFAVKLDSNLGTNITDNSGLQYWPHHREHDHGYRRPGSREMFLFAALGVMIIFMESPRYH